MGGGVTHHQSSRESAGTLASRKAVHGPKMSISTHFVKILSQFKKSQKDTIRTTQLVSVRFFSNSSYKRCSLRMVRVRVS